jgi:penicillin amidase
LILGHNGKVAWVLTTTHRDTQDFFIEWQSEENPDHYLTPSGTEPFATREEVIKVKDEEDVRMTVRATRHGPVLSDVLGDKWDSKDGRVLALAWPALRADDRTAEAFYRMNRAHNWETFRSALTDFHSPQQNVLYADRQGAIAFAAPGRVPVRRSGDGRRPVPGWTERYDWTGIIPFEELPASVSPQNGILVNANNRVVDATYPYLITADWPDDYRAKRIEEWFAANGRHSVEKATTLQLDTLSGGARDLLPVLIALAEAREAGLADALGLLENWDYRMDPGRPEPLLFYAWMATLNELLLADELDSLWQEFRHPKPEVLTHILTRAPEWCDDTKSPEEIEDCPQTVTDALDHAITYIEKRFQTDIESVRWGEAHRAEFTHPIFSQAPFLADYASFGVEAPGGDTTINRGVAQFSSPHSLFQSVHGSGLRAVYDLANLERSRFMIATGQSGNPLSPFYGNMATRWRDGEYVTFGAAPDTNASVLTLMPR